MGTRRQFLNNGLKAGLASAVTPLASSLLSMTSDAQTKAEHTAVRPNILILFPDQWRFDWISSNPLLPLKTPNIDRLNKLGTRFTKTVVATPLCAPSRACLASGMAYGRAGVPSNGADYPYAEIKTFYSRLRDSGYHVMGCGKMDLAKKSKFWGVDGKWHVNDWGFSDGINNAGKLDQLFGYTAHGNTVVDPYLYFLKSKGVLDEHLQDLHYRMRGGYGATNPTPLSEDEYCDNWLTQNGLTLLDQAPKDKPWMLQVNWTGPHNPEDITKRMEKTVRGLKMPAVNGTDRYDAVVNEAVRQNYTAMCENVDRTIGLYLEKLEQTGQMDRTLIVYTSDHGEMLGDHGRWGKEVPYHPSASVPLTVCGPGVKAGVISDALISHIDLTATYLDFAGVDIPKTMDSKTLRPLLEGKTTKHRDVVFSALNQWRMAYDGQYKAITGFNPADRKVPKRKKSEGDSTEAPSPVIFDMAEDPGENKNLFASHPAGGTRLLQSLMEHA